VKSAGAIKPLLFPTSDAALAKCLTRYRVMAYIVGVGLAVLVFIGVPLRYGFNQPIVVEVIGPVHGFLYIAYLLAALDLTRRARFSLLQMAAMVGSGLLPLLAFYTERKVTARVHQVLLTRGQAAPSGG
jgi:integral membrane protein